MARKYRQSKRGKSFFKENVNAEARGKMSEVCKIAHFLYEIFSEDGRIELSRYLHAELGCDIDTAAIIAANYHPDLPPVDVCPVALVETSRTKHFEEVFEVLRLQIEEVWPKNLLGWYVMRRAYGDDAFDFVIDGSGENGRDNRILFPNLINGPDGNPLPFGLAALNAIKVGELPASIIQKAKILMSKLGETGEKLAKVIYEADMIFPPKRVLEALIKVIQRGLDGEEIVLTGAFCPDYAYRETGRRDALYEYTFSGLGDDVGLVAKQFVRVLPKLIDFLREAKIPFRVRLGIGDFEADSEEILKSVGVNREEFLERCRRSNRAFRAALSIPMEISLIQQEWTNGRWAPALEICKSRLLNGDFGRIKINTEKDPVREAEFIASSSASFYRRWYNRPDMDMDELVRLVLSQGAEYAAMGMILAEDFASQPFIQIAGDRPKMQIFNSFASDHPTLCCKRIY